MARSGAKTGGNSKSARSTRKYKRNSSGQFGSGAGKVHAGRRGTAGKAGHQSNGGPSAQRAGSAKTAGHRSTGKNSVGSARKGKSMSPEQADARARKAKAQLIGAGIGAAAGLYLGRKPGLSSAKIGAIGAGVGYGVASGASRIKNRRKKKR